MFVPHLRPRFLFALALIGLSAPVASAEPKTGAYPLAKPPLEMCDRLGDLGKVPPLSDDERKVLQRAWDFKSAKRGTVDDDMLLDAALFGSGIEEPVARKDYRQRFAKLVEQARDAVKDGTDDRDRGEKLMRFLHAGVMKKGYVAEQTSFAAVLDGGTFNCVSSTAVYYLVGSRLGLTLKVISIPGSILSGHAALDLVDGKERVQVEPTNPDGFDWKTKSSRPGVIAIGYVPDRKDGHEVDALGIPAMIYSNRGVALGKAGDRLAAARCYLAALAADPTDGTAGNNLLAVFGNWGPELVKEKKFEEAVKVMRFAQAIAATDDAVKTNATFVWEHYIDWLLDEKKDADAVAAVRRAGKAVPTHRDFESPAHWFERLGGRHVQAGEWDAALAVVDRGLRVVDKDEAKVLAAWRTKAYRLWSQDLLGKADFEGSLTVLGRAYDADPADREVHAGVAHHTHTALPAIEAKNGRDAMAAHFAELTRRFPKIKEVAERGVSHAGQTVQELVKKGQFAEAVAAVKTYAPLLPAAKDRAEVGALAYDGWAQHLADKKEWQAALDKYAEGLKAYPKEGRLENNLGATVDDWAKPAVEKEDWVEAGRIYRVGLKYLPDDSRLKNNAEVYEERARKKK